MAAPEGYVPLDLVGFTDKGDYEIGSTYAANDLVHNDNKIYRSLQDNNVGHDLPQIPESKTEWWELWLSGGADDLGAITVQDTSNVTGGGDGEIVVAQALIDAIANKIMNDMVTKDMIVNNLMATIAGKALDATQGKTLDDKVTQLKNDLSSHFTSGGNIQTGPSGSYPRTALIKDGETLHVRLQLDSQNYHEIIISSSGISAARIKDGIQSTKEIVAFS